MSAQRAASTERSRYQALTRPSTCHHRAARRCVGPSSYEGECPRSLCFVPGKGDDVGVATSVSGRYEGQFEVGALIAVTQPHLMSKKSPDGRGGVAEMKASLDKKPSRPLTAADLCDRCSARAVVETVMMQGGSLLWCAHHLSLIH